MDIYKTREERTQIVIDLLKQMLVNELPHYVPGIIEFRYILNQYVQENLISGFSGTIKIPEMDMVLEYNLPIKKIGKPMVRLKNPRSK